VEAQRVISAELRVEALSCESAELLWGPCWETGQPTDHTWSPQQTHLYSALHPGSTTHTRCKHQTLISHTLYI